MLHMKLKMPFLASAAMLAFLSGCSVIDNKPSQDLEVTSMPPGATCVLTQADKVVWSRGMITGRENITYANIGSVVTPGKLTVQRSGGNINIVCNLTGYQETTVVEESFQSGWVSPDAPGALQYKTPVTVVMKK